MTDREQTNAFSDDLDRLVDRYRREFDMTYASVTSVLQMKIFLLNREAEGLMDEDGPEEK